MTCYNCGHLLPNDSEFCQYCGKRIEKQPSIQENAMQKEELNPVIKIQPEEAIKNLKETKKAKKSKVRFCKFCGGQINPQTKKCVGCGKQYFKGIKLGKNLIIAVLAIMLITSVLVNAIQHNENTALHNQASKLNNENIILNSKLTILSEYLLQPKDTGNSMLDLLEYRVKKEKAEKIAREVLDKTSDK